MKSFRDEAFLYYDFKPKAITKRPKQILRKCPKQVLNSFSPSSSILGEKPSNLSSFSLPQVLPKRLIPPGLELLGHSFLNLESDLCDMQRAAR